MTVRDGFFGRILAEAKRATDRDEDGAWGRLAGRSGASPGGSVRSRLLQGLARSGGFARQASFGLGSRNGPEPGLRLNTRQRVIVKAHVAKHGARGFGGGGGGGALRAHVVYLGREGRDGPERGEFYDRDGEGLDAKAHVRDWAEDRHHFRFIISPEHGDKLEDLRGFVRSLMDEVATDLREPGLDWIAVNHFDTDQPHAHVLVRGAREDGRALMIPKDYMARGFRARAEDRATQELGEVSRDQAEERLRKEVTADRVTGLDRHLEKSLVEGRVPTDFIDDRHTTGALLRGRLQHLEGLGLAAKEGRDWWLAEGFTQSLESLSREQDVLRTLHARMAKTRVPVELVREGLVAGRVVEAGREGLVVEDGDGVERLLLGGARGVAKGSLVIAEAGERGVGVYPLGDPSRNLDAERLTPTDGLLTWRAKDRAEGLSPPLFDAETEGFIGSRAAFLREAGLAVETEHGIEFTDDGWGKLREADIRLSIKGQLGRDDAYQTEALFAREGRYLGTVRTQSGLFAVAERGAGLVYGEVSKVPQIAIGQAIEMNPSKGLIKALDHGLDHGLGLEL
ncbi:MAG: DUF3363 domain-containing protein [Alphaproteobacteria bacterium]|nr:DUF3363 domain-containing protein [Alphaproteobacteria bacterium]